LDGFPGICETHLISWSEKSVHNALPCSAESTKNNINMYRFTREMVQDGYTKETKT
jgi:hypothetical protein